MDNRILNAILEYLSKIFLPSINGSIKGSSKEVSDTIHKSLEPVRELSENLRELGNLKEIFSRISEIKGEKGEKGDTPEKGVDYLTDEELAKIKEESTPIKGIDYHDGEDGYTPIKGKDYFTNKEIKEFIKKSTPIKGKDYKDGIDGRDGIDGTNGIDGKDGSPDKPKDIVSKLESLEGEDRLDVSAIKGIEKLSNAGKVGFGKAVKYLRNLLDVEISNPTNNQVLKYNSATGKWENGTGGGGTGVVETIVAGSNITVDDTDPANPIVGSSILADGGVFLANIEVPDDAYDATTWNGNFEVPTKNAIRDKIETISGGGVSDGDKGDITVSSSGTVWTIDSGLDAAKIADGSVSNTEFQYINSLTSNAQTQLDTKTTKAFAIAMACAL